MSSYLHSSDLSLCWTMPLSLWRCRVLSGNQTYILPKKSKALSTNYLSTTQKQHRFDMSLCCSSLICFWSLGGPSSLFSSRQGNTPQDFWQCNLTMTYDPTWERTQEGIDCKTIGANPLSREFDTFTKSTPMQCLLTVVQKRVGLSLWTDPTLAKTP